jgi:hypothetical protein
MLTGRRLRRAFLKVVEPGRMDLFNLRGPRRCFTI